MNRADQASPRDASHASQRDASALVFTPGDVDRVRLSPAERRTFRQQTAKHESPWIAASVASVAFAIATLNSVIGVGATFQDNVPIFLASLLLAVFAPLLGRSWMPAAAVPWIDAGLATVIVLALLSQEYTNFSDTGLLYSLFAIAAYGPIALDFRAAVVAAVPMAVGCVWVSMSLEYPANLDWIVGSAATFLISGVLLAVRLRGVDALAKALALHASLATEDPLTGMLNRRGLDARLGQALALAKRGQVPVSAMFIDIDGLKQVNDRWGHNVGDRVITTTAEAIRRSSRAGDFVCRWGGDEFLVLAIGISWNPEVLSSRILERLAEAGFPAEQWPGTVTFGWATIDPVEHSFDELVERADAAMYAQRVARLRQEQAGP